jgi:hypothetical protein
VSRAGQLEVIHNFGARRGTLLHMPEVGQVQTVFQGFSGAPGYNNLYFWGDPMSPSTCQDAVDDAFAFWNNVVVQMSQGISFAVQPDVKVLDEATGALQRIQSTTPSSQSNFASAGAYAGGVGAVASWNTAGVHLGKPLRGRTFIVPLGAGAYENNGTIGATPLAALRTHTTTLAAVANFGVWGRPVGGAGGDWAACTGGSVKDQTAWLKTRRT